MQREKTKISFFSPTPPITCKPHIYKPHISTPFLSPTPCYLLRKHQCSFSSPCEMCFTFNPLTWRNCAFRPSSFTLPPSCFVFQQPLCLHLHSLSNETTRFDDKLWWTEICAQRYVVHYQKNTDTSCGAVFGTCTSFAGLESLDLSLNNYKFFVVVVDGSWIWRRCVRIDGVSVDGWWRRWRCCVLVVVGEKREEDKRRKKKVKEKRLSD